MSIIFGEVESSFYEVAEEIEDGTMNNSSIQPFVIDSNGISITGTNEFSIFELHNASRHDGQSLY